MLRKPGAGLRRTDRRLSGDVEQQQNALTEDWFAVWRGLMLLGWLGPRGQVVHGNGALSGNSQLL
jgi:hypothetical protein